MSRGKANHLQHEHESRNAGKPENYQTDQAAVSLVRTVAYIRVVYSWLRYISAHTSAIASPLSSPSCASTTMTEWTELPLSRGGGAISVEVLHYRAHLIFIPPSYPLVFTSSTTEPPQQRR